MAVSPARGTPREHLGLVALCAHWRRDIYTPVGLHGHLSAGEMGFETQEQAKD